MILSDINAADDEFDTYIIVLPLSRHSIMISFRVPLQENLICQLEKHMDSLEKTLSSKQEKLKRYQNPSTSEDADEADKEE